MYEYLDKHMIFMKSVDKHSEVLDITHVHNPHNNGYVEVLICTRYHPTVPNGEYLIGPACGSISYIKDAKTKEIIGWDAEKNYHAIVNGGIAARY
jgi:hypothetical protein